MKSLLITGFEPFGKDTINASWECVSRLPDRIGDFMLTKLRIPVTFGGSVEAVLHAAEICKPDAILCVGQAEGRREITPEYIAVNVDSARIPDNAGEQPSHCPIIADGEPAYYATLPVLRMTEAITGAGILGKTSYHAGTFVCNHVLYSLLHHFRGTGVSVGFIHVPLQPEQARGEAPVMPLEQMEKGLTAAIEAL